MAIRTPQLALRNLRIERGKRTRRHLADIELLVAEMVPIKTYRIFQCDSEVAVHTTHPCELGLEQTFTAWCVVALVATRPTIPTALRLIELATVCSSTRSTVHCEETTKYVRQHLR